MAVATAGTLSEYDMILSLSQKAINDQFLVLFHTPNQTPSDSNLISNIMKLGYLEPDDDTGKYEPSEAGITATIDCPAVDFTNIGEGNIIDRSFRFKIHMKTALLTHFDGSGKLKQKHLDGWTASWVAEVGSREIQHIEEEAMHPNAKKAIQKALKNVPHDDFLVSSLFCLFESTVIANSFSLTDSDGKPADKPTADRFADHLTMTIRSIDHKQHPYVLGYGISQKIPKPLPDSAQAAFTPSMFTFSTTPYKDDNNQATLNFCMMSATNKNIKEPLIDSAKNPSAGILAMPFIYQNRAANLKPHPDGVFAVSESLLFQDWLKGVILDRMDFGPQLAQELDARCKDPVYEGGKGTTNVSKKTSWQGDWIPLGIFHIEYQISGDSNVDVKMHSILQDQPSGEISVSATRSLTLEMTGKIYNKVDFGSDGYIDATTHWNATLLVKSANDGTWSIERGTWKIPDGDTVVNKNNISLRLAFEGVIAVILSKATGIIWNIERLVTYLTTISNVNFDNIGDSFKGVSNNVIMPCGDVYTFMGLDCDKSGNVYTYIKYKTIL